MGATKDLDTREESLHLSISTRVIMVLVGRHDVRRLNCDVSLLQEAREFGRFTNVNNNTRLRVQVARHIVAEIIREHRNDIDFHHLLK